MNDHLKGEREPLNQRPIKPPKEQETQRRWILLTAIDEVFCLTWLRIGEEDVIEVTKTTAWSEYDRFFEELHQEEMKGRKWWLIGYRTRYALQRADLFQGLADGRIKLVPPKRGAKQKTYAGKVTISERTLEIDVAAGKVRIKMLDWENFGVYCDETPTALNAATPESSLQALSDYLHSMATAGIPLSRPTAAQLGWVQMRRHGLARALWCNPDKSARELERRAYHNGRCEPYEIGEIPGITYALDVKACYAAICQARTVPIRMLKEYPSGLDLYEIDLIQEDHWIADVILNTTSADYPMRDDSGQVYYPTGQFYTTLTWPELKHALQLGRVEQILCAARYESAIALKPYADWCLRVRAILTTALGPPAAQPIKTVFNAALGFTARKAYEWVRIPNPVNRAWARGTIESPETNKPVDCMVLDSNAAWLRTTGEPREAIPYLHATICAWCRMELLCLMNQAGRENVLYVDTDGLLVTQEGINRLADLVRYDASEPGDLVPKTPPGQAVIQGQKNYRIGDYLVCAGLQAQNHSQWKRKKVKDTPTGMLLPSGRVRPHSFHLRETGDPRKPYSNEKD